MKLRNTLILFGIVVILSILVYFLECRKSGESDDKSKILGEVLMLKLEDMRKVELAYRDDYDTIIAFRDANSQWLLEKPIRAKVNQEIINERISKAMRRYIQSTLQNPGELSEYGLDNPRVTATFYLQDGTSRTIMMGDTVPTGNYVYLKQKDAPDIFLVPGAITDDLTITLSELVGQAAIVFDASDVRKILLKYADSENIVCEKSGINWRLVEPLKAEADRDAVEEIILGLGEIRLVSLEIDPGDFSRYGLEKPRVEVVLYFSSGEHETVSFGKREDGAAYVKMPGGNSVFSINAEDVDKLIKTPFQLRDKTVITFDRVAVQKLELKYQDTSIVIEKKLTTEQEEIWEIAKPAGLKADRSKIDEILRSLLDLRADEFLPEKPGDLSMYGLSHPRITATVFPRGTDPRTLLVGKEKGKSVYVKTASGQQVYLVNNAIVSILSRDLLSLRDPQVMRFDARDVSRMELRWKDRTITCLKQEYDWRIMETREKADNYKVNSILDSLKELKAQKFVTDKAESLSDYDLQVALTFKDGKTQKLLIRAYGRTPLPGGETAYAKLDNENVIFVISRDVLDQIDVDLDDLREIDQ